MASEEGSECCLKELKVHTCGEPLYRLTDPCRESLVSYFKRSGYNSAADFLDYWVGDRTDYVCTNMTKLGSKYQKKKQTCALDLFYLHTCSEDTVLITNLFRENAVSYFVQKGAEDQVISSVCEWTTSDVVCCEMHDTISQWAENFNKKRKHEEIVHEETSSQGSIGDDCDLNPTFKHICNEEGGVECVRIAFREVLNAYLSDKKAEKAIRLVEAGLVGTICRNVFEATTRFSTQQAAGTGCRFKDIILHECTGALRPVNWELVEDLVSHTHKDEVILVCKTIVDQSLMKQDSKLRIPPSNDIVDLIKRKYKDVEEFTDEKMAQVIVGIVKGLIEQPERQVEIAEKTRQLVIATSAVTN